MAKDSSTQKFSGFTLLSDDMAEKLNAACPAHKLIIDSWFELWSASMTLAKAGETYWQMTAKYGKVINNNPTVKPIVQSHNMRIHEMVRQVNGLTQELAHMMAQAGIAIEEAGGYSEE